MRISQWTQIFHQTCRSIEKKRRRTFFFQQRFQIESFSKIIVKRFDSVVSFSLSIISLRKTNEFSFLFQFDSSTLNELFDISLGSIDNENLKFLCQIYERFFTFKNLPTDLTIRLAERFLNENDVDRSMKIISEKFQTKTNDDIFVYLTKFLDKNSSKLSIENLFSIGNLSLSFRMNETIRKFWRCLIKILFDRTSQEKVLEYFSKSIKENNNLPYLDLFEVN